MIFKFFISFQHLALALLFLSAKSEECTTNLSSGILLRVAVWLFKRNDGLLMSKSDQEGYKIDVQYKAKMDFLINSWDVNSEVSTYFLI